MRRSFGWVGFSLVLMVASGCSVITPPSVTPPPPPHGTGRFAYVADQGDSDTNLYLMNTDASGQTKVDLGAKTWMIDRLAWSADGQKLAFIAFLMDGSENSTQALYTVQSDGSGLAEIARTQGNLEYTWSPDGKWIAYLVSRAGLTLVSADGSQQIVLESGQVNDYAWSPDGAQVLLTTGDNVTYVDGVDGAKRTIATGIAILSFAWSPGPGSAGDGNQIALTGLDETSEDYGVFVVGADSPQAARIVSIPQQTRHVRWSPDGGRIVFEAGDIFSVNPDGSDLKSLVTGELFVSDFVWSPGPGSAGDGQQIAFLASGSEYGQYDLYLMKADGSDQQRLTDQGAMYPVWSPDGTRLLFTSVPFFSQIEPYPPEVTLYVVDAATRAVSPVITYKRTDMNQSRPIWSLDGKTIIFAGDSDKGTTIQSVGSDGSNPAALAGPVGTLRHLVWYPAEMASNVMPLFRR